MTEIILHGVPVELDSELGQAFVRDAVRAAEGLIKDSELQEIYEISPEYLKTLASNKQIGNAIRNERNRRVNSGQAARENAAKHFVRGPTVLANIMDNDVSARAKIESVKALHAIAVPEKQNSPAQSAEKFIIRIDLTASPGGEIENYDFDQPIKIDIDGTEGKLPERPKLTIISGNEGFDD